MATSEKEIFQKRIRELRGNLTQKEFADMLGIGNALISDYETGRTQPTSDILDKFVKYAKVNLNWLFTGIGEKNLVQELLVKEGGAIYGKNKSRLIPVVGSVGCGLPLHSWEDYGNKLYNIDDASHLNSPFILIAKGDSMVPYINPGDKLLCADEPTLIKNRSAVIVSFKTEPESSESNVKLIKFLKTGDVMLYSVNTKHEPIIVEKKAIYYIYKLVRIIRDVK